MLKQNSERIEGSDEYDIHLSQLDRSNHKNIFLKISDRKMNHYDEMSK
jgi:hypothetical protein